METLSSIGTGFVQTVSYVPPPNHLKQGQAFCIARTLVEKKHAACKTVEDFLKLCMTVYEAL